ncbi:MAG: phosphatase PAP2 family protein [Desulfomonile tiedjei]|nr:phosphatase PAP2 family protein [Desulfomonile tiedjei]
MRTKEIVWLVLLAVAVCLTILLKYVPYFPGDVSITLLIQSLLPESKTWAQVLSSTAAMPWILALIAVTFALAWKIAGWRASLLSLAAFIGLALLGKLLGPVIAQPRPSPELVQVTGTLSGSAFPSIFAFNYAATVGFLAVLAVTKGPGRFRWALLVVCISLLAAGWIARVALAAHWPSDVALSYLIGILWVTFLMRWVRWKGKIAAHRI